MATLTDVAELVQFLASFWVKRADRPVPGLQKPTAELEAVAVRPAALGPPFVTYPIRQLETSLFGPR